MMQYKFHKINQKREIGITLPYKYNKTTML